MSRKLARTRAVAATAAVSGAILFAAANPADASKSAPYLKEGSKGFGVRCVQYASFTTADGDFGPKTTKAVKRIQAYFGLKQDGIVGPKTGEEILFLLAASHDSRYTDAKCYPYVRTSY